MSCLRISLSVLVLSVIVKAQTSRGECLSFCFISSLVFLRVHHTHYNIVHEQLDSALHHYDTLHADHIDHSYSTGSTPYSHHRHVKFNTLGRYV